MNMFVWIFISLPDGRNQTNIAHRLCKQDTLKTVREKTVFFTMLD